MVEEIRPAQVHHAVRREAPRQYVEDGLRGHAQPRAQHQGLGIFAAGRRSSAALVLMAAALGFSRVYLGFHYPSDVVAGWALAVVWLALWPIVADRRAASPALSRRRRLWSCASARPRGPR